MREGIKRNIKSEISTEVEREAKNILVSVSNLLSTKEYSSSSKLLGPDTKLLFLT